MRVGIIGPGHIGSGIARQLCRADHELMLSFSRDRATLEALAAELGGSTQLGEPREAVDFAEVLVISVPWRILPEALEQLGPLNGRIIIDTTNQYGGGPQPKAGETAAQLNAQRMGGSRYTKSFNTLTAGFQAAASYRRGDARVVQWLCGDDAQAKTQVSALIADAGFVPVDVGGTAGAGLIEPPRRAGAVYGEEYRDADARAMLGALDAGAPLPSAPTYRPIYAQSRGAESR